MKTGEELRVWDVGGSKIMRGLWRSFYRNVDFVGAIYVANVQKSTPSAEKEAGEGDRKRKRPVDELAKDRKELSILLNEKELENVVWLVLFNVPSSLH